MKSLIMSIGLLLIGFSITGCATNKAPGTGVPDSIPMIGGTVDQAEQHVESADALVVKAKPESNAIGQALLNAAIQEHGLAEDLLKKADAELAQAEKERQEVEQKYQALEMRYQGLEKQIAKIKSEWGYRLQVFVTTIFWILVILCTFHVLGGLVALFVPGPIGAFLSIASRVVNPGGWIATIFDNLFHRGLVPASPQKVAAT